ncbi:MAG: 16S rRNA (uracil(1498)-N(3))-methyltransferase [Ardenticatenales bacterium]|nr:16S rRNA (uracil(1498)-N(3))-methyltransferase [Ardenticatenales bacterium]
MHRFFVSEELIQGDNIFFPADLAHQISRVLRLNEGARVIVLDNSGTEREVELHSFAKRSVQGTVRAQRPTEREPRTHLTLYMALLKGKKLDWVFQKGTELGVSRFVPLLTRRSVVGSLQSLGDVKLDRWEAIAREAAEQSGRGRLPQIVEPQLLEVALGEVRASAALPLIAWEQERSKSLKEALHPVDGSRPTRVALFVGPEGGFEENEVLSAQAYGAIPVSLGPRILRAETAMVAAATAILYELGDWEC